MAYPVRITVRRAERYSRLTTFLRVFLIIPHAIWLTGYSIAASFVTLVAWFVVIRRGVYSQGAFEWQERYQRYAARVFAYSWLLTDRFPPFHGREDEAYPSVVFSIDQAESLSRLTTALRIPSVITNVLTRLSLVFYVCDLYIFPAIVVEAILSLIGTLVTIVVWFAILFTGRYPASLFEVVELPYRYGIRVTGFATLVTDRYPWFQPETDPNVPDASWHEPLPAPPAAG